MYIERTLETFLKNAAGQFPVLLVTGPRQVGKTTILKHLSKDERTYVTLDDPILATMAREEPALFLQRFKPPVLIDEIQYAPELLPYLKMAVDQERKKGMFWLTGSQQFQLMQGVTESLAGRVGIVNLLGLSAKEMQSHATDAVPFLPTQEQLQARLEQSPDLTLTDVYRLIWRGAFPEMALNEQADRDFFYSSYIQTYLQRDVRDLANVGDESAFLKFLRSAAARTGQLVNMSDMARDAGVAVPTAKRWLSILETSGIIHLLEPYHSNTTKRLVKAPKLYFLDTGLCAYLTEWTSPETLEAGAMSGAMLETYIFTEILKSYWHNGKRAPLYYYRDRDKKEIDLLIVQDNTIYPLEFKKTGSPDKGMVKQFGLLEPLKKDVAEGGVICLSSTLLPLTKTTNAIPVGIL
ncbi:MAG: ATP-binding protein [Alphaproteobacteria bacterium]